MANTVQFFAPNLLQSSVWLITGGGTGIGYATALLAGSLGAQVVIAGRKAEPLELAAQTLREQGCDCLPIPCDIREPEQIVALVDHILTQHGHIDVLVNNAGGQFPSPAQNIARKGWDAVIRNNLSGTWYMTQEVANKAFIPQKRGAIINVIANIFRGIPGMAHTGAARAGVDNLTKTLAVEWAPYHIRINAVAPGIIHSSGIQQYPFDVVALGEKTIPFKRLGTVEEVAQPIVFLGSDAASYISGTTLYVDGAAHLAGDIWNELAGT